MSRKLKLCWNWNVTETEISLKLKCNWNWSCTNNNWLDRLNINDWMNWLNWLNRLRILNRLNILKMSRIYKFCFLFFHWHIQIFFYSKTFLWSRQYQIIGGNHRVMQEEGAVAQTKIYRFILSGKFILLNNFPPSLRRYLIQPLKSVKIIQCLLTNFNSKIIA